MFEIESKNLDEITIKTAKTAVTINVAQSEIDAGLAVGKIKGPGEFEIGEISIKGIAVMNNEKTMYDVQVNGVHVGIIGGIEDKLDDILADVLCTSSVRAVREISPKLVVAMGNVDGMVADLKLSARSEKKIKIKNIDSLPASMEVVVLN